MIILRRIIHRREIGKMPVLVNVLNIPEMAIRDVCPVRSQIKVMGRYIIRYADGIYQLENDAKQKDRDAEMITGYMKTRSGFFSQRTHVTLLDQ